MNPLDDQPIDHFKKQAKRLAAEAKVKPGVARARVAAVYRDAASLGANVGLMRAQHVIAVESGFRDWNALVQAPPIEQRLAITMAEHPALTAFGLGVYEDGVGYSTEQRFAAHVRERAELRSSTTSVTRVVEWLRRNVAPTKAMSTRGTSYGFKHQAEREIGYITNGAFIAAGMIAGYPYKLGVDAPIVYFGFNNGSLRRIAERAQHPTRLLDRAPAMASTTLGGRGINAVVARKLSHEVVWRERGELRSMKFSEFDSRPPLALIGLDISEPLLPLRELHRLDDTSEGRRTSARIAEHGRQQVIVAYDELKQGVEWIVNGVVGSDPSFGVGHVEDDPATGRRTWSRYARHLWSLHHQS